MEKICRACGQSKPVTEFHKDRSKADGLNFYCKPCTIARVKVFAKRPPRRQASPGMKWCGHCKTEKPVAEFHASSDTFDGLQKRCKTCAYEGYTTWRKDNLAYVAEDQRKRRKANPDRFKDYGRKARYGLAMGEFDRMLKEQGGECAICHSPNPGPTGFHVDHCHETGVVRGILCHGCNVSLGHFKHDEAILQSAIEYLRVKR